MVFSKVAKKLAAKANSSEWRVGMITLNVTLEGNKDFKDATGKTCTCYLSSFCLKWIAKPTMCPMAGVYFCKLADFNFAGTNCQSCIKTISARLEVYTRPDKGIGLEFFQR